MAVLQSNKEMKEVFIFGAGASNASAGTPLGKVINMRLQELSSFYSFRHREIDKVEKHDKIMSKRYQKYSIIVYIHWL